MAKIKKAVKKVGGVISTPVRKIKKRNYKKKRNKCIAEMIQNGTIKQEDLFEADGRTVDLDKIYEEYIKLHPEDDEPETDESETTNSTEEEERVIPAFTFNSFVFNDDGSIAYMDSSQASAEAKEAGEEDIVNYIINNKTIKELFPDLKEDSVTIENGIIILTVKRNGGISTEKYRLDIFTDGSLVVQAPFNFDYVNRFNGGIYHFVSVPVDSDLGKDILTNENREITPDDFLDVPKCIFRFTADEI
jgi:hypothetical protein